MYHTTKDGKKIKIPELETSHIVNIIRWIEQKASTGFTVRSGGGSTPDEMWYDEETYYGEKVKKMLNYYSYKVELNKRDYYLSTKQITKTQKNITFDEL